MKTPLPFQSEGIDFLLRGGSMLAFDCGLGKTLTTVWAAIKGERFPLLIGCPGIAQGVWMRELIEGGVDPDRILILTSDTLPKLKPHHDIVIVTQDLPARNAEIAAVLAGRVWDQVVIDEAHRLKNLSSLRGSAWVDGLLRDNALETWHLSATPAPIHVGELYPLILSTEPERLEDMTREDFERRYCRYKMVRRPGQQHKVETIDGSRKGRIPELRQRLDGWWLRKKRAEVMPDLPAEMPPAVVPLDIKRLTGVDLDETSVEAQLVRSALEAGSFEGMDLDEDGSISRMRRLLSASKGQAAAEYAADKLDQGEPAIVLWFWHKSGMDACEAALTKMKIGSTRVDGNVSDKEATRREEAFQRPDGPPIFLGQIERAGVALTLTRASLSGFVEGSWNPMHIKQCRDRINRIGQTRGTRSEFLTVRGSLDDALMTVVARRQEELDLLEG